MAKLSSPYYPPRARWYGVLFDLGYSLRRSLTLDRIPVNSPVPLRRLLAGFIVPGLAFWLRGQRPGAIFAPLICAVLFVGFLGFMGYTIGNVAFGLLLSVHSTGFVLLCEPFMAGARLRSRLVFSIVVLVLFSFAFYLPGRAFLEAHIAMPLQLGNRVIVVHPLALTTDARHWLVRRGEWIAYTIPERHSEGVNIQSGLGLGPILAMPADRIRFTPNALEVNNQPQPRRPSMPTEGECIVPEKSWFVWPDVTIGGGHGYAAGPALSTTLRQVATVSHEQFIGKPYKRWFWRRQVLL